jgi:hypothetical protein
MLNVSIFIIVTTLLISVSHVNGVAAQGTAFTFKPVADAYVNQSNPDSNYGTNKSLLVDNSPYVHSYLRFTVTGLNTGTIQSAILRLYANSSNTTGVTVNKLADNTWSETAITYTNAPTPETAINNSGSISSGKWVEIDVSNYIQGDGSYNLVLTTTSPTNTNLASRESGSNSPQLVVNVADGALPTSTSNPAPTITATQMPTQTALPTILPTTNTTPTPALTATPTANDWQPAFPIRAAFYYPWFPEAWTQLNTYPYTNYTPKLGFYSSRDSTILKQHIDMMQYGNIQAGIASWWGQGSQTDTKIPGLLSAATGTHFRWALYYENESKGDPSVSQIQNDLNYILSHYGKDPSYLRVNGKFVVFVYADANDGCAMVDRWKQANTMGAYIALKVFTGFRNCTNQPDGWHQYSPAVATSQQGTYSYSISPGFWLKGQSVRLARDLTRWTQNVKDMISSGANWQLVTTFSEWGEGTIVEPAVEWASASGYGQYLDVLHQYTNTQPPQATPTSVINPTQTPPVNPTTTPTNQSAPTSTPTSQPTPTIAPTQTSGSKDPIIFFTGDLVSGNSVSRAQKVVDLIKKLMGQHQGTQMLVASTGDNEQENNPTLANYQDYFGATYGTFVNQGIFMQIRGNHDIQSVGSYTDYNGTVHTSGAAYWDYFGANAHMFNIAGQKLTDYSYDLGSWHIIGLDQLNGNVNNATLNFLTNDLAAHTAQACQIVYWHVPTYSSGIMHGDATGLKALNQSEYNFGVDIQLNGHDHDYQRFYPINPNGVQDNVKGITTFIDGIGGQDGRAGSKTSIAQAASAVYMDAFPSGEAIGVIQFTLHPNSADYALYDGNTGAILDQGTVACH